MRHRDDCTEFVAQPAGDKAVIDALPKEANEAIIDAYKIGSTNSEEWTPFIAGTIVSSIDAAAVFAILRSKRISLLRDLRHLLELKTGSNDPMAISLTIGFTCFLVGPGTSIVSLDLPLPSRWF
jgi:hypothetical protein